MTETELQQACARFVHNEVKCCLSSLVSALAGAEDGTGRHSTAGELIEQAYDLTASVDDYEEAAIQAGWHIRHDLHGFYACTEEEAEYEDAGHESAGFDGRPHYDSIQEAAEACCVVDNDIEPYQREVFEHWAVSSYLADALEAQGEKVDRDFAGLIVWARTTTGQAISMDHCIRTIVEKMHAAPVEG